MAPFPGVGHAIPSAVATSHRSATHPPAVLACQLTFPALRPVVPQVRQFAANFKSSGRRLDALVCNAAVYLPTAKEPRFTADGFEVRFLHDVLCIVTCLKRAATCNCSWGGRHCPGALLSPLLALRHAAAVWRYFNHWAFDCC